MLFRTLDEFFRSKLLSALTFLRRGWDSNPRYRYRYTTFPGWPIQPLLHLSETKTNGTCVLFFTWPNLRRRRMSLWLKPPLYLSETKTNGTCVFFFTWPNLRRRRMSLWLKPLLHLSEALSGELKSGPSFRRPGLNRRILPHCMKRRTRKRMMLTMAKNPLASVILFGPSSRRRSRARRR